MKSVQIVLTDKEFKALEIKKERQAMNWHDFVLFLSHRV